MLSELNFISSAGQAKRLLKIGHRWEQSREGSMKSYSFEVRRGESVQYSSESIVLEDLRGVWAMVEKLSKRFDVPGSRVAHLIHEALVLRLADVA